MANNPLLKTPAKPLTRRAIFFRQFLKNQGAVAGTALLLIVILTGIFGPLIAPKDPLMMSPPNRLLPPTEQFLLGTDQYGRDILSRIIYGARISLQVGFFSNIFSVIIGMLVGVSAGYYGDRLDMLMMRLMDVILSFPALLLALTIIALVGQRSLTWVMIALGIVWIPVYARLIRGAVLSAKQNTYVEAARVVGMSNLRLMWRHILPNSIAPVIVLFSLLFGVAIRSAASLSFLGMGAQPPTPEWGLMLFETKQFMRISPWVTISPGVAILLTVLAFNLVGDGLRKALDPRMKVE